MEWGTEDKQEFLRKLWESHPQGEIPQALANKPTLSQWNAIYFEAFHVLMTSREVNENGYSPIPLSEINHYMQIYEISDIDERDWFIKMIKALDAVYIPFMNKKLNERMEAARKAAKLKGNKG